MVEHVYAPPGGASDEALPLPICIALAEALVELPPPDTRRLALRQRILASVHETGVTTIRSACGEWKQVTALVQMKLLYAAGGSRSFLLRLAAGAALPPHFHSEDEECMVLEGEVQFGDIVVRTGDYHLARKGTSHGTVTSATGALLFLRAADSQSATNRATHT